MSVLIEFMGLPGSGKSTVAGMLKEVLLSRGVQVMDRREAVLHGLRRRDDGRFVGWIKRLPSWVWEPHLGLHKALPEVVDFLAQHPALGRAVGLQTDPCRWDAGRCRILIHAIAMTFAQAALLHRHAPRDATLLVDEGFCQRGFTLFGYGSPETIDPEAWTAWLEAIPAPQGVIWVDADAGSCARRLAERAALPLLLGTCEPDLVAPKLEQGRDCLIHIAEKIEDRNIQLFAIRNGDAVSREQMMEAVHDIAERIAKLPVPTGTSEGTMQNESI